MLGSLLSWPKEERQNFLTKFLTVTLDGLRAKQKLTSQLPTMRQEPDQIHHRVGTRKERHQPLLSSTASLT
jgi:hypothetical protein